MRIDGYYNREPSGLSDNTEEATFSFAHATIPLVWLQMKFFLLCMARKVHKMFTKNQHSPIDSANNECYITYRTKEEEQKEEFRIRS